MYILLLFDNDNKGISETRGWMAETGGQVFQSGQLERPIHLYRSKNIGRRSSERFGIGGAGKKSPDQYQIVALPGCKPRIDAAALC